MNHLPKPPTTDQSKPIIMRELPRAIFSPYSMDLRFLLCEHGHASLRSRIRTQQTRLPLVRSTHNLSDRFKSLENRLRPHRQVSDAEIEKATPVEETLDILQAPNKTSTSTIEGVEMEVINRGGSKSILRPKPRTFKGVSIPIKPPPPAADGKYLIALPSRF